MNKTILIVSGASVVSMAAGAAGGYLFAKRKFDDELTAAVAKEVLATEKHYAVLLMQAKSGKPDDPADVGGVEATEEEIDLLDVQAAKQKLRAKGERLVKTAEKALTDYQGISTQAVKAEVVEQNIFADAPRSNGKPFPPKDPITGKFVPRSQPTEPRNQPYLITAEEFLTNEPPHGQEHEQESYFYYAADNTVVSTADLSEVLENAIIGEENLQSFPDGEDPSVIYVRHEALLTDYQVTRTFDSLVEDLGLGESDRDLPDEDYVDEHANQG